MARQLTKVHELIEGKKSTKGLWTNYIILSEILSGNPFIAYNTGWLYYKTNSMTTQQSITEALALIGERPDGKEQKVKNEEAVSFCVQ